MNLPHSCRQEIQSVASRTSFVCRVGRSETDRVRIPTVLRRHFPDRRYEIGAPFGRQHRSAFRRLSDKYPGTRQTFCCL
jgi:hypothetical protein